MSRLDHPLKEGIERLRAAILDSNDAHTEHVKWNAPSFCYAGEDRVTFRLFPRDRVQLVFHRGSKVKDDADTFAFDDDTGLLQVGRQRQGRGGAAQRRKPTRGTSSAS